ncbi:patatin-like phospholipase family protein [Echinicola pacifica]|uniref:patatin-like phospholipase family protein n=1 Tax=Echinicola pacifica TaxID=346377 RepID=UPI000369ED10|nr:patatin-like phospholipase family protein [Echinicola pacifica]
MQRKFIGLLIIFLFLLQLGAEAQQKPKVGLVLSGGGAKGIAHVGIIQAMERAGVRPDYIVGTSMGSVIGGLYAIGYSGAELEEIVKTSDWELMVSNRVSYSSIAFEEKEYYNRYLFELPVIDGKIAVPAGLIEGQKLSETLHYYSWPSIPYKSFDDFPIPFRAIATDVKSGKAVVLESGYLADAMRASIAIPTAFTPFEADSTLFVDGGVVNNFPVDIVREMGADYVIGINVGDEDFLDPKELDSFSSILMQIAMTSSYSKLVDNIAGCDIYIKPDLLEYSTASFSAFQEILDLGKAAGEEYEPQFEELAKKLPPMDPIVGIGTKVDSVVIHGIVINGNKMFSDELIRSKLGFNQIDTLSRSDLQKGIDRVFGVNGFSKVGYQLSPLPNGAYRLVINTKEKQNTILSGAFHYDNVFSAGVLLNLTMRDLLGKPSRTVAIADISQNPKFRLDHYKYLGDDKKYAINVRYDYLFQQIPEYEDGIKRDLYLNRQSQVKLNFITTHSLKQSSWFGPFFEHTKAQSSYQISIPSEVKGAYYSSYGLRFLHIRSSLNDRNFPTQGSELIVESLFRTLNKFKIKLKNGVDTLTLNQGDVEVKIPKSELDRTFEEITPNGYLTTYFNYQKFFALGNKVQLVPSMALGLTISGQDESFLFNDFSIGGYQRVQFDDTPAWGLNYGELTAENFGKLGLYSQWIPSPNLYIRAGTNLIGHQSHIPFGGNGDFDMNGFMKDQLILGFGVDASLNSFLGPITAGLTTNTKDGAIRPYLAIGFSFNYSDR